MLCMAQVEVQDCIKKKAVGKSNMGMKTHRLRTIDDTSWQEQLVRTQQQDSDEVLPDVYSGFSQVCE
ncbi:hypothetical protein EYF80_022710 [Liparis tanakae]|uniref:Uncharacterized protein n=1 Tax=Liparis tanakae TaxID=230148 RepID=A0A4Z2HQ25_9TELE|nr:hypothetical protein EYF80_022710 [Liparis tanakae]